MSEGESEGAAQRKLERETYLAHRRLLMDAEFEQGRLVSKALVALSGGGLGLTLTFANQIAGPGTTVLRCSLFIGWACLIASLLAVLIEYAISAEAFRRERDLLDLDHEGKKTERDRNGWTPWTTGLTWLALGLFILGVICLAVFTGLNLAR